MSGPLSQQARRIFWSRTKRLTLALLAVWLLANLLLPWFARDLHGLRLGGFPLGYWLVAEGALLLYLAIIVIYIVAMDRLEAQYQADSDAAAAIGDGPGAA